MSRVLQMVLIFLVIVSLMSSRWSPQAELDDALMTASLINVEPTLSEAAPFCLLLWNNKSASQWALIVHYRERKHPTVCRVNKPCCCHISAKQSDLQIHRTSGSQFHPKTVEQNSTLIWSNCTSVRKTSSMPRCVLESGIWVHEEKTSTAGDALFQRFMHQVLLLAFIHINSDIWKMSTWTAPW